MATKTRKKSAAGADSDMPGVFSISRSLLLSDGAFYNQKQPVNARGGDAGQAPIVTPLMIVRHGLRGTQNVNDVATRDARFIQTTESAKRDADADLVLVRFGLRALDLSGCIAAVASKDRERTLRARMGLVDFIKRVKASDGLHEVCRRLARNVANGSWLWRNRHLAAKIDIVVKVTGLSADHPPMRFDALSYSLDKFDNPSADENRLARLLRDGFLGAVDVGLDVEARIDFGILGAVEVHPSQGILDAGKTKDTVSVSRPLYRIPGTKPRVDEAEDAAQKIMGQAGLRAEKMSNRIKCIDTWYDEFAEIGKALPIEPEGASLEFQDRFRMGSKSAYHIFAVLQDVDPNTDQGMFAIGILIRGGVLGASESRSSPPGNKADVESVDDEVETQ